MSNFERQIIGEIPLHEAASFFVEMKQSVSREAQVKTAGARMKSAAQQVIDGLLTGDMPEGKAGRFKPVNQIKEAGVVQSLSKGLKRGGEVLSGASGRKAMSAENWHGLTGARLQGMAVGSSTGNRDELLSMAERRLRAAKRAGEIGVKEERKTQVARGAAAGLAGVAVGRASKSGSEKSAASQRPPGLTDRQWVHEFYVNRLKMAAAKLGFGMNSSAGLGSPEANMEGGQPSAADSNLPALGGASMAPPSEPIQDPEAAKPTTDPTVPVNYMGAELMARAAQQANEVGFLRERLNVATEQNNALTQQVQEAQVQLQQLNETSMAAGDQISQAANEAVAASDRALQHSMMAANMRMGIQKMREAMMELASQDPESMGTLAQQQQVQEESAMAAEQQAVNGGAGTPGQTATSPTGPGAPSAGAPQEGGPESGGTGESGNSSGEPKKEPTTKVEVKTGSIPGGMIIPGALAGAGLAGLAGYRASQGGDEARAKVEELEGQQEGGSFRKALELSRAKQQVADTELREKHPVRSTVGSALGGAAQGAVVGSALNHLGQTLKHQALMPGGL